MSATKKSDSKSEVVVYEPQNGKTGEALAVLDQIHKQLASITTVDDAKDIAAKAAAAKHYAQRAKMGLQVQNRCAYVKVMAERRAGALLLDMDLLTGRPEKASQAVTLSSLGIDPMQSSRWQRLAGVEEAVFEQWLRDCNDSREDFTSAHVWRMMKTKLSEKDYFEATHAGQSREDASLAPVERMLTELGRIGRSLQGGGLWGLASDVFEAEANEEDVLAMIRHFQVIQYEAVAYIDGLRRKYEKLPVMWQKNGPTLLTQAGK